MILRKTISILLAVITPFVIAGCRNSVGRPVDTGLDGIILSLPIDTAAAIASLGIRETFAVTEHLNEKIGNLTTKIDTIELTYFFPFDDCQRWIISDIHYNALEEHPDLDGHDPRGQVEFDLDRYGFYIEAAERALAISDRLCVNGTKIRFVGREYRDRRLPEDSDFTIPNPPKGRVLRYYAYEVLRPYKVWGPLVLIPENGDSILSPTILTVE